jgi:hypothetical protein
MRLMGEAAISLGEIFVVTGVGKDGIGNSNGKVCGDGTSRLAVTIQGGRLGT